MCYTDGMLLTEKLFFSCVCSGTLCVISFWIELIYKDSHLRLVCLHIVAVLFSTKVNIFVHFKTHWERTETFSVLLELYYIYHYTVNSVTFAGN